MCSVRVAVFQTITDNKQIPDKAFTKAKDGDLTETVDPTQKGIFVCRKATESQGPVIQRFVSLTSSLRVKMLTVLVSTISNSQAFLLKK